MLHNFLLTLHIMGAIIGFGPTFVFPLVGSLAKKEGAPAAWLIRVNHLIEHRMTIPVATLVQPGTGAGLIIISHGAYAPFERSGRWLLVALCVYVVAYFFAVFPERLWVSKSLHLAEAGDFGPEFASTAQKVERGGMFLTVLLLFIIVMMVTKPNF